MVVRNLTNKSLLIGSSVLFILFQTFRSTVILERTIVVQDDFEPVFEERPKTALCAVVKSEEFYLEEWIHYYLYVVGFDHLFLFDNSPDFELNRYLSEYKQISVFHIAGNDAIQRRAYLTCGRDYAPVEHTYVAFLDTDEFLVLKKHKNIQDFVEEYLGDNTSAVGAISISWRTIGYSGRKLYQPLPVTLRFQYAYPWMEMEIKTIARLDAISQTVEPHPHYTFMKEGRIRTDTAGNQITRFISGHPAQTDVAILYHYRTKSHKEFILKRMRGESDRTKSLGILIAEAKAGRELRNGTVFDDSVWQKLIQARPQYRMFQNYSVPVPRYQPLSSSNKRSWSSSSSSSIMARTAVLCSTTQNEEAYIDEWVDYHLALGFTQIALYDMTETFELEQWSAEKRQQHHDKVRVYPFHNKTDAEAIDHCRQRALYVDNREQAGTTSSSSLSPSSSWIAHWEVGSMLILRQHKNVLDFLAHREKRSSSSRMVIKRQVFQVSDQELYRPRPFTYRFRYVSTKVDEDHVRIIELRQATKNDTTPSSSKSPSVIPVAPTKEAVLFAYPLRAAKEYVKRFGGSTDNVTLFSGSFLLTEVKNHVTYTDEGWEVLKQYVPWYAEYEKL